MDSTHTSGSRNSVLTVVVCKVNGSAHVQQLAHQAHFLAFRCLHEGREAVLSIVQGGALPNQLPHSFNVPLLHEADLQLRTQSVNLSGRAKWSRSEQLSQNNTHSN